MVFQSKGMAYARAQRQNGIREVKGIQHRWSTEYVCVQGLEQGDKEIKGGSGKGGAAGVGRSQGKQSFEGCAGLWRLVGLHTHEPPALRAVSSPLPCGGTGGGYLPLPHMRTYPQASGHLQTSPEQTEVELLCATCGGRRVPARRDTTMAERSLFFLLR